MKRFNGFWVIGIAALVIALISPGMANAGLMTLTLNDNINTPQVITNDTGAIIYHDTIGVWQIDVWAYSQEPTLDQDFMFLRTAARNTSGHSATLDIELAGLFSIPVPFLGIPGVSVDGSRPNGGGIVLTTSYGNDPQYSQAYNGSFDNYLDLKPLKFADTFDLVFKFTDTNPGVVNGGYQGNPDLTTETFGAFPTPEPSALFLLGSGLAGLAGLRARRRG